MYLHRLGSLKAGTQETFGLSSIWLKFTVMDEKKNKNTLQQKKF